MMLDTRPRLEDPDAVFALLVAAHAGLDEAASRRLDARLVLILANHIGDPAVLRQAVALAASADRAPGTAAAEAPGLGQRPGLSVP
ncbi:DUF2783 domain-containing protein [Falsiroseomonas tokyonensis]|uniref:DUF2783 domain-containing protein n=1 Tax=Falsiroseomonas tokyonensis TaxID=430521 RepID=A0ABV7BMV2_9PROT|nr:DUF2783 domain-containing protein [Falsiroseomonas tokyonensis]MBU8536393.1 DUF2783 domain-containing protein [Falsiroseomonas tokyonensis]